MGLKYGRLTSALPRLKPASIVEVTTGEYLTFEEYQARSLTPLLTFLQNATEKGWEENKTTWCENFLTYEGQSPAEYGRAQGVSLDLSTLPRGVKAKSRVERLYRYSVVSTVTSYPFSQVEGKKEPGWGRYLNLGAVDKQMASLSLDEATQELTLLWKCWEDEYLLTFNLPSYVRSRNITKWCLPVVTEDGFVVSYQEKPVKRKPGHLVAGLDLGRVVPFTMAVVTPHGKAVAQYRASGRLNQLNRKRERLLTEKASISRKVSAYESLGLDTNVLRLEAKRVKAKASRLGNTVAWQSGSEVTRKLLAHDLNLLRVEDLAWVKGAKYGGRWNHSVQQNAIEHTLLRQGVKTKRVNPRDTSQTCPKCGTRVTHNASTRTAWCKDCKTRLDRDFLAALNIARDMNGKNGAPPVSGGVGAVRGKSQAVEDLVPTPVVFKEPVNPSQLFGVVARTAT